ncbi:tetratricopeptide repeat protein [Actinomadura graeca]|uniref:Tetratricopeptide repeat protein n=1 Tax=Actinomadura graeca TaxID=2750812 RepID=A0ABX8QVF6_9ACTN|nr:tetratricopeptide repeat protein [Actinomadura graeca]QXJ21417.1 tetratricopeptide repeat protein [Actinomadura graeca]
MEFGILGPLEIRKDGQLLDPGPARHQKVLTAFLLSANRVVPVSRLIDVAWYENPPATARKQVRNIVSDLRRLLNGTGEAGLMSAGQTGYRLRVDTGALDASLFDDRVARARRHAADRQTGDAVAGFRAALALWRGSALAGLDSPALEPQRALLEEKRLTVLEESADLELTLGRHHRLSTELAQWVREYPLRERLTGLYMLALSRAGRQAEALQAFQQARRVLVDHLGIEPGAELQRSHQQILAGEAGLAAPPARGSHHFLPRDITDFTGRTAELERLRSALPADGHAAGAVVISAIDGMAGIGKTTLAVHAAHRLTDRYPDAQVFIDLFAHTAEQEPLGPAAALETLLRAMEVPSEKIPEGVEERAALWRAQLAGRRALVVLDNAASAAQVRPLLPGTPGCLVLITSRRRLPDLEAARTLSLGVLSPEDAAALFTRVAGDTRPPGDPRDVQEVVRLCGYLPLAIRIAAARLRARPVWDLAHLIERLRQKRRLTELAVGDRDVAAAFALSYQHLTRDQRRQFRMLGVHPGGDFDAHAAAALADVGLDEAARVLEHLVDVHLLEQPHADRYRLHDLLRLHAVHLSDGEDSEADRQAALTRTLDHYRHTAALAVKAVDCHDQPYLPSIPASSTPAPSFADPDEAVAWLEAERPNLVAAATHAAEHGWPAHVADLSNTLWCYFEHRGGHDEALRLYTHALTSARDTGDRDLEGHALHYLGLFHRHHGRNDQALVHYEQALTLACDTGDRTLRGRILGNLGPTLWHLGRGEEALVHYRQALAAARDTGDFALHCGALEGLGSLYRRQGRHDDAISHYERALDLARDIGDRRREPFVLNELGGVYGRIGRHEEAFAHLNRALDLAQPIASRLLEGLALYELGAIYGRVGRCEEAVAHLRRALDLARETANGLLEGSALCELGTAHARLGDDEEAAARLREALDLARETANRPLETEALNGLGEAARRTGDPGRALTRHQDALALAGEIGSRYERARALDGIARAHHGLGHRRQAAERWTQALAAYTELGVPEAEEVRAMLGASRSGTGR